MNRTPVLAAAATFLTSAGAANAVVLYDGSLGTAPDAQPWLVYDDLGEVTRVTTGSDTTLDTTAAMSTLAGYSNYQPTSPTTAALKNAKFPTLDSKLGFDLTFTAELDVESHSSSDRGGFDVILLDQNHDGVELDFWTTQVWAQNAGFTHGESTAGFNPAVGLVNYDLHIVDGTYSLSADGSLILTGATRDYSSQGLPYDLGRYVFLGDDTTEASAAVEITQIGVVPEPGCVTAAGAAILMFVGRRRRKFGPSAGLRR
jgi:hypothetical protein